MMMTWDPSSPSYEPSSLPADEVLPDLQRRAQIFEPRFKALWDAVPAGTPCWHNRLSFWVPPEGGLNDRNGTVALVGLPHTR